MNAIHGNVEDAAAETEVRGVHRSEAGPSLRGQREHPDRAIDADDPRGARKVEDVGNERSGSSADVNDSAHIAPRERLEEAASDGADHRAPELRVSFGRYRVLLHARTATGAGPGLLIAATTTSPETNVSAATR